MAIDPIYHRMITSARWRRLRRQVLTEHPLCEHCQRAGFVVPACEVHHRAPVEEAATAQGKEMRMFDLGNLVALCHDCHVRAHVEMGRSGRSANKERTAKQVAEIKRMFFGDED